MRIALVTPEYVSEPYFSGGLANYVHRLAMELIHRGHDVHVVVSSDLDPTEITHDEISVHRVSPSKKALAWANRLTRHRFGDPIKCLARSVSFYRKLKEIHRSTPIDIVQFPDLGAAGLVSQLLLPVPSCVRASCYRPLWGKAMARPRTFPLRLREGLELLQLRLSKNVFAPSVLVKAILETDGGIRDVRVIRTPIYLETQQWDDSLVQEHLSNKDYVLYVGRFELHKGFHILCQALPGFLEANPEAYVVFAGLDRETALSASMQDYAVLTVGRQSDRLLFVGEIPHSQLYPVVARARLVVLPSLVDNFPNACLEAMALGKPVIGTTEASFDEILTDGVDGFLVPSNDARALSAKIDYAWRSPILEKIGEAALQRANAFAPEYAVTQHVSYYESITRDCSVDSR